jgi:hypothetical protein
VNRTSIHRLCVALAFSLLLVRSARPAVVINEVSYDDGSTDDREFVELYNNGATAVDIGGWTLEGRDQAGANATLTFAAGTVVQPNSYFLVAPIGVIPPGADPSTYQIMPGPPPPPFTPFGYLENDGDTLELRNGGALVDALLQESNKGSSGFNSIGYGTLPADVFADVGGGFWGNVQTVDLPGTPLLPSASLARFVDGRDTNINGRDFGVRPATPGRSNNPINITQYVAPDVTNSAVGSPILSFGYNTQPPRVIDPSVADAYNPNAIPAAPGSPTRAIIAWDANTQIALPNGNTVGISSVETFSTSQARFDIRAYLDTRDLPQMSSTTASFRGSEVTIYGIGSTDSTFSITNISGQTGFADSSNGTTGVAWVYEKVAAPDPNAPSSPSNPVSERLYLVDAKNGGDAAQGGSNPLSWDILASIDLSATNSGWFHLGIDIDAAGNGVARFENQFFNFTTLQQGGAFSVGYNEFTQMGSNFIPTAFLRPPTFVQIPEPATIWLVASFGLLWPSRRHN